MSEIQHITLYIGGVHVSRVPAVIKTVLGSCISVCVHDPITGIGGMNHFMLPSPGRDAREVVDPSRFGIHAMDLLIGGIQKLGGDRRRLQGKLFGGAHVLCGRGRDRGAGVPEMNIEFIREFMQLENIPVVNEDLGGYLPRQLQFHTGSGKAYVKRLGDRSLGLTRIEETEHIRAIEEERPGFGEVTVFEE